MNSKNRYFGKTTKVTFFLSGTFLKIVFLNFRHDRFSNSLVKNKAFKIAQCTVLPFLGIYFSSASSGHFFYFQLILGPIALPLINLMFCRGEDKVAVFNISAHSSA